MQFNQNNLNQAASPYLRQHKNNPIHWQEWSQDVLDYAKENNKIIFLSIGYSTCHWCHVMAEEAFSDKEIADYLNNHFVSIKIDKEQRPDIDKQMMDFLISYTGNGGWPLNVFLTSNQNPFYPLTYLPLENFLELIKYIKNFYEKNNKKIEFQKSKIINPLDIKEDFIIEILTKNFDHKSGGFGLFHKFPLHSTMLFMLHYYEETKNENIKFMITKTLDAMMEKGLNDHLQGGFFRYCVDNWNIPHFEKMLYDQAMHLWVYCLSYKTFEEEKYKIISEKILNCLLETFLESGFFISAHDADTNHEEGLTYLWDYNELKKILNQKEFDLLKENYQISDSGNFKGKIHFIKKNSYFSNEINHIERKLLEIRNKKEQPFKDEKFITSWNSLAGIALINAYRYLKKNEYLELAKKLFSKIYNEHFYNEKLFHSSFKEKFQEQEFLEDYASFLLFITYLHEETNDYKEYIISISEKIKKFKEGDNWIESENKDFIKVYSDYYDNPISSSASLAELALIRTEILLGNNYLTKKKFKEPLKNDFLNISVLIKKGLFHIITSENKLDWKNLPLNTIQKIGSSFSDCYKGSCRYINNY